MSDGDHSPSTTRRNLLSRLPALAAVGTIAAIPTPLPASSATPAPAFAAVPLEIHGPDAELLALAGRCASVNAEIRRLEGCGTPDEVFEPLDDVRFEAKTRAVDLMPATPIGLRAKAQIIVAELELQGIDTPDSGIVADLAASLARDVVRVMGRA